MPAIAMTAAPMPTPIPAIAAWDRPLDEEPSVAALEEVALGALSEVEDGEDDFVGVPVVSTVAEVGVDSVLIEVVAAGVAVVEDEIAEDEGSGTADVLVVVWADGVGVCEASELGAAVLSGLGSGWPIHIQSPV